MAGGEVSDTPSHYPDGTYEPINVIEAWGLGFSLGNVLKYIARAGKKGDRLEDLQKALYYLQREIEGSPRAFPLCGVECSGCGKKIEETNIDHQRHCNSQWVTSGQDARKDR